MVTKPQWGRKRWKSGRLVTLQSFKVFEVLLCRCLYIMGYSWECGRLLLRICHNDFWFCGILTDRLVSKIFWRHWLYERSRTFAWFSQKLQWFNTNKQFSIYSIWNIYSTSKTLPIQKKWNPTGEKFWVLVILIVSTAGLNLKSCKKLFHITPKNINK